MKNTKFFKKGRKIICELFRYDAPIVFITGRFGFGKTDFSLLIAEILLENKIIKKFGSNIGIKNPQDYPFQHITNIVQLKKWLYPKTEPKLFILDEAGIHTDRRNPTGRINREIRHIGFLLRKFSGKFIFISQRGEDIDSTFAHTDIWLATFHKIRKDKALLFSNVHMNPKLIRNIPRTSIKFDTRDIAPFSLEPTNLSEGATTKEEKIFYDWLETGSYHKVGKKYGLFAQEVKRIVLNQVKALVFSQE